jgi:hypothetical protein
VELDDVCVKVLLDFLLSFEFEGGELLEVDFDGFEGGFLVEEVEEVLFFVVEVGDLGFEFEELLLVGGEVFFDVVDEGELGFEFMLDFGLEGVVFRAVDLVVQLNIKIVVFSLQTIDIDVLEQIDGKFQATISS